VDLTGLTVTMGADGQLHTLVPGEFTDMSGGTDGPGLVGVVYALTIGPDGSVYAGGDITTAGSAVANHIARWDGTMWSALGSGMNGTVRALAVGLDGSVYAGGDFTMAGTTAATYVARWDGTAWSALSSGMNGRVRALVVGSDGSVYAGGDFTNGGRNRIARWNGTSWRALGTGMAGGTSTAVHALAVGPDGSVYAGGDFTTAGGVSTSRIARWDGTVWSPLGSGITGTGLPPIVHALAVGPDGSVYAGGLFATAGGVAASCIARWNGTAWSALGSGMNSTVFALAIGADGSVYAGGAFTTAGGSTRNYIARWFNSSWRPVGSGILSGPAPVVYAVAVGSDGSVYPGGGFTTAGVAPASYVARWDGSAWRALGSNINSVVFALAVGPDGSVYAGGDFTTAGGVVANRIARWDGVAWSALGSGMDAVVRALAVGPDGSVYAGGSFSAIGGSAGNRIARWDGTAWSALGSGMNAEVRALAVGPDGSVYAGGSFGTAGGGTANHIARWNGTAWSALGSGMSGSRRVVHSLAVGPDGSVFAGGSFTSAGGVSANNIARWDGTAWSSLGSGVSDALIPSVYALAVGPDGSVYAGGDFATAGGVTVNHIARWDGSAWSALGSGVSGSDFSVRGLAVGPDGSVYAGGLFMTAGGVAASRIARWDGTAWSALGSGMNGFVHTLVMTTGFTTAGDLVAGGAFTTAGGVVSPYITLYDAPTVGAFDFEAPTAASSYRVGAWLKAIWTSPVPAPANVILSLRKGAGPWQVLYTGPNLQRPDFGAARWQIPDGTLAGDDYQFRIEDAADASSLALSDLFIITDPQAAFVVSAPAAPVARGGIVDVTWTAPVAVPGGSVRVELVTRSTGAVVASETTPNDGTHELAVPADAPGGPHSIIVTSVEAPSYAGTSAPIGIRTAAITSPAGGENYVAGETVTVAYEAPSLAGTFTATLTLKQPGIAGGTRLSRLSSAPASGTIQASLPASLASGTYYVVVSLAGDEKHVARSAPFTVEGEPTAPRVAAIHFALPSLDGVVADAATREASLSLVVPGAPDGAEVGVFAPVGRRGVHSLVGAGVVRAGRTEIAVRGAVLIEALVVGGRADDGDFVTVADGAPLLLRLFDGATETTLDASEVLAFADGAEWSLGTGATDEAHEALTLTAWPNPVSGTASVRVSSPAEVAVYDVLGRRVAVLADGVTSSPRTSSEVRWDTRGVAPGVYVIRASTPDETAAVRVTVMR